MDKRRNHIIFWVGYFLYYLVISYFSMNSMAQIPYIFIRTFSVYINILLLFYFFDLWVFPLTMPFRKYALLFIFSLISWILLSAVNYGFAWLINMWIPNNTFRLSMSKNISWALMSLQQSFAFALMFWVVKKYIANVKYELVIQEKQNWLRRNALDADLLALKNQINPHFFYNMLNFFYAQSLPYSKNIPNAILKLSDMMRYTIRDSNEEGTIPLEKEIDYLRNYAALENIDRQFKVAFKISGNPQFRRVTPLIFQPILNHSFLWGSKVMLDIDISNDKILFSSKYSKKEECDIASIVESVENIQQKFSSMKRAKITFKLDNAEHCLQLLLVS